MLVAQICLLFTNLHPDDWKLLNYADLLKNTIIASIDISFQVEWLGQNPTLGHFGQPDPSNSLWTRATQRNLFTNSKKYFSINVVKFSQNWLKKWEKTRPEQKYINPRPDPSKISKPKSWPEGRKMDP